MSVRIPAGQQQPALSRPNLEELAAILRSRKDRSGEHIKTDKSVQGTQGIRKKSVSNRNDSGTHAEDARKLRTQVESLLSRRAAQTGCSGSKPDDNIKSAKKGGAAGNYFLTADVSNVLRAINLNMDGSLGRRNEKMMTEDDIDRLFGASRSKKKRGDKENNSNYNFKPDRAAQLRKDLLTSKTSMGGTAGRLRKKDLVTDPDNQFDQCRQETELTKVGNVREFMNTQEEERVLGKTNKDFAESIRFLQMSEEPSDKLIKGLSDEGLQKMEDDPAVDKTSKFKSEFLVGKQIGEGAYASVRVAVFKPTNHKVAIKIYEKKKIRELPRKRSVRREIRILQQLDHPHIVKILDVIETNNHVNIIMEYISGIPLSSHLKAQPGNCLAEKDARRIFQPLVDSVQYLHSMNVSHRDIKLENVLLDSRLSPKLIDFGFATCIMEKARIFCGTPSYMSPEIVLRTEYRGEPADVWALGVLLYVMLTGVFPFKGQTDKELYKKIVTSDYPRMEGVSKQGVTIIARMLTISAEERITAEELLRDEWITGVPRRDRSGSATLKIVKKSSENTPKHCFEILENIVRRSSEKIEKPRNTEKVLAQTQKESLKYQLRVANGNIDMSSPNWSPKNSMPNTCTNRQTTLTKLDSEQKLTLKLNEQVKKKSEERLNNKKYF